MGWFPCCCACDLTIADIPEITIAGMSPDGDWIIAGECCFSRRYTYDDAQPRQLVSTDLQRISYHRITTQILKKYVDSGGCGTLFDCVQGDVDTEQVWFERLGLIYQRLSVDVFIQFADVDCPEVGALPKYVISVRHNIGWLESIWSDSYINEFEEYTDLGCCTGSASYDVDDMANEPDYTDVTLWPGYSGTLTDGEYWHHEILDAFPVDEDLLVDGCLDPCTVPNLCSVECEGVCITSDPTETIPTVDGVPVCPTPTYTYRTCTATNGFGAPCWAQEYYSLSALTPCPRFDLLYGNMATGIASTAGCVGSIQNALVSTTYFDLTTACDFYTGAEICINDPISLTFGLAVLIP